jgi:hypothetical protein
MEYPVTSFYETTFRASVLRIVKEVKLYDALISDAFQFTVVGWVGREGFLRVALSTRCV